MRSGCDLRAFNPSMQRPAGGRALSGRNRVVLPTGAAAAEPLRR